MFPYENVSVESTEPFSPSVAVEGGGFWKTKFIKSPITTAQKVKGKGDCYRGD